MLEKKSTDDSPRTTVRRRLCSFLQFFQIFILLLLAQPGFAQPDSFGVLRRFGTDVVQLAVDNLDNLYVVSSTDQLKKYNAQGDSVGVYNLVKRFGKLQSVDVTNPLKLLLFYKEFSTVVVLDRLLTFRASIDLRTYNIIQTSAVGLSYDGNIWLFDEYEAKLKKIDEGGTVLLQTPDLRNVFQTPIQPQQIFDQNGTVYLYDAKTGLYLFDYYGSFKKKLPITGWQNLAVTNNLITGMQQGDLHYFNTATLISGARKLPATMPLLPHIQIANNKVFSWSADSVHIYNMPF